MKTSGELTSQQKHLLFLVNKGADESGWAKVSKLLFKLVLETAPAELVEVEGSSESGGRARLTEEGKVVLKWA